MPRKTKKPKPLPKDPSNPSPVYGRTFEKEVYTREEIYDLLEKTSSNAPTAVRNKALITTLWQSGLRISEALDLLPEDFDFNKAQIHVRNGKGGKPRRVQVGPDCIEATRRWLEKRATLTLHEGAPLFCTLRGDRQKSTYIRVMLQRLAKDARWTKRIHPHGFRHTFAVNLSRYMSVADIQQQLGHESLQTTGIYLSGISTESIAEAMKNVKW